MGHNASKYVMDLASDSSNFIEVLVRALRNLIGDLPEQCAYGNGGGDGGAAGGGGDECPLIPDAVSNAKTEAGRQAGRQRCVMSWWRGT